MYYPVNQNKLSKPPRDIRIRMTPHAISRSFDRGIDKKQIESVLKNPIETVYDKERKNYKSVGMPTSPLMKEQPYLLIVHSKFNSNVKVITVMWKGKGGLKGHGFSKL